MEAIVRHLRTALPRTRLVLMALLPRADMVPGFRWPNDYTAVRAAGSIGLRRLLCRLRVPRWVD